MNVKSLITLLAFAGFAASCSNSDFDDPGTHPTDGRAEIQIAFSGTGESQEYTRAIASESIEGTITKQTVKVRLRNSFMAWKIFTFFILKKLIIFAQNGFLQSKHNHSIIISEQQADRKKCE